MEPKKITRKQFVALYVQKHETQWRQEVKAGTMRPSEFAASCVGLPQHALVFWRKYRGTLAGMTVDEVKAQVMGGMQ